MSRVGRFECEIENVNRELAETAMEILARRNNVDLMDFVTDFYGKRTDALAIDVGGTSQARGFGISIEGGKLSFLYDDYSLSDAEAERLKDEFKQVYVAVATQQSLTDLGFQVSSRETDEGILLEARG